MSVDDDLDLLEALSTRAERGDDWTLRARYVHSSRRTTLENLRRPESVLWAAERLFVVDRERQHLRCFERNGSSIGAAVGYQGPILGLAFHPDSGELLTVEATQGTRVMLVAVEREEIEASGEEGAPEEASGPNGGAPTTS